MLFHLLKFMVECGCNRAHRALKGDIFAEALQFPIKPVPLLSVAAGPEHFPVIMRAPEEKEKQNGFQVLIWRGRGERRWGLGRR